MGKTTSAFTDRRIKNWERLLTSNATFQIESIRIIESNIFAPQTITLPRALALIGLHGTGKTLLLRLLEAVFGYVGLRPEGPPFFRVADGHPVLDSISPAPIEGIIEVTLRTPNGLISNVVDLAISAPRRKELWSRDLGDSFSVWYTGPLQTFNDLSYVFQEYDRTRKFVDKISLSRELTSDELHSMRNILGRSYDRLTVSTVDVGDYFVPYFSGAYQSREIDATTMSNGELWVHYINWWLQDNIPEGNLALIDEPEAFLAARGRRPFIDQIATQVLRRKMQLIVGTHSPEVLARFPLRNIRMCLADSDGIQVLEPTSMRIIKNSIRRNIGRWLRGRNQETC